ncbi:MAG: hypothetical protein AMXMBFR37_07390 [Steroidobacteraceae bacterium]|jgi:hypothetical protein
MHTVLEFPFEAKDPWAYRVPENARIGTLPCHFGPYMVPVEDRIYSLMREFCPEYDGGCWEFYELSNGGFFMTPPMEECTLSIRSNGYEGTVSGAAAGIVVCLFAYSLLGLRYPEVATLSKHFRWLREFALDHPEAREIWAAID